MNILYSSIKSGGYLAFAISGFLLGGSASLPAVAADVEAAQEGKQFSVKHLKVKVGDTVHFTNKDPFFHNVYSLSPAKIFDLGSYPEGEDRTVTFDQVGHVEVECAIHPRMHMTIEITAD